MSTDIATQVKSLRRVLNAGKEQLEMALQSHMNAETMIRLALTAVSKSPKLAQCTPTSIGLSLLTAGQLGLQPDGRHAYLVPFWNSKDGHYECQFIAGYMGLVMLASRNGCHISAQAVRENDEFDYEFGTAEFLRHRPAPQNRGKLTASWSMARFADGTKQFVVIPAEEVEKHRQASQTGRTNSGPWAEWPDAMWAKTAVIQLSKFVPLGDDINRVIEDENGSATIEVPRRTGTAGNHASRMFSEAATESVGQSPGETLRNRMGGEPATKPATKPATTATTATKYTPPPNRRSKRGKVYYDAMDAVTAEGTPVERIDVICAAIDGLDPDGVLESADHKEICGTARSVVEIVLSAMHRDAREPADYDRLRQSIRLCGHAQLVTDEFAASLALEPPPATDAEVDPRPPLDGDDPDPFGPGDVTSPDPPEPPLADGPETVYDTLHKRVAESHTVDEMRAIGGEARECVAASTITHTQFLDLTEAAAARRKELGL
jgi:recombination protein RecT